MECDGGGMIHIVLDLNVPGAEGILWSELQRNTVALLKRHVSALEGGVGPLNMIGSIDYDNDGQVQWSVEGEETLCPF